MVQLHFFVNRVNRGYQIARVVDHVLLLCEDALLRFGNDMGIRRLLAKDGKWLFEERADEYSGFVGKLFVHLRFDLA